MRFSSAILLGLALIASACGSSSSPSSPSPSSPATPSNGLVTVDIQSFSYQPNPVTVKMVHQINWLNKDSVDHTATADDGRFDNFVNAMSAHGAPVTMGTADTLQLPLHDPPEHARLDRRPAVDSFTVFCDCARLSAAVRNSLRSAAGRRARRA